MVTAVPIVPVEGVIELMVGGFTVKAFPGELPASLVTTTRPVVASKGTAQVIAVLDHVEMEAVSPLNVTEP
jgi:hypothetical protein